MANRLPIRKNESQNVKQTTIPTDALYSPFWAVNVYDNADFSTVNDLVSAKNANILMENAMLVNCPVVFVEQ